MKKILKKILKKKYVLDFFFGCPENIFEEKDCQVEEKILLASFCKNYLSIFLLNKNLWVHFFLGCPDKKVLKMIIFFFGMSRKKVLKMIIFKT